jgi:hypothetical protein
VAASAGATPSGTATRSAYHDVAGPSADLGDRGVAPADHGRVDVRSDRGDRADQVVAGHERERWLVVIPAAAHLLLGEGDPGRLHPNDGLAGSGVGDRAMADLQTFRLHPAGQHDLDESFGIHDVLLARRHIFRYKF